MNQRVLSRFTVSAVLALAAAAGQAQVFSTSPFLPVPPVGTGPGTMSSTLDVSGAPIITDLNVILDITHTFCGDLDIILVPPSGDRYIHLTSDNGGAGDNFTFTRFDQSSNVLISAGVFPAVAPFNGTFRPEGGDIAWRAAASIPLPGFALAGLDDFNGIDPNGTWTLIIDDDASGDLGTLNYWSLELNGAIDSNGPSFGTPPTAIAAASPNVVPNDGTGVSTLTVTVSAGSGPTSTFNTSGSVTVDGSAIGAGTITLLDNGVFPDQIAGDLVFSANATVGAGTPGALYALPYNVTDDQARFANGNINLTVTQPAPPCAPGAATISFAGVQSNGAIGDPFNSVVTGDFGLPGSVNQVTITGRFTSFPASYRSEARIRMTAPNGSVYDVGPYAGAPASSGVWDINGIDVLVGLQPGTGMWTFEFWESFADTVNPDAVYDGVCFSASITSTSPSGTGIANPNSVVNDGTGVTDFFVTVSPGAEPLSTGITVFIDGSPIGMGNINLFDNGVFPDAAAGDNVFSARATIPAAAFPGNAQLPFNIADAQGRFGGGNIALRITEPPPPCAPGAATLSFAGVQSNGAIGDASNSVVSGDFGLAGNINQITITGRLTAFAPSYRSEARIRMISPNGTIIDTGNLGGAPASAGLWDIPNLNVLVGLQPGSGNWTFEFYESLNDGAVNPDAVYDGACFTADLAPTNPLATASATPAVVSRDGLQPVTLRVNVTPGQVPASTGITVFVDDSAIGGTGSLALLDDGVFPDEIAGDNIFTASTTVAYYTNVGLNVLTYNVADAQGRSTGGNINITVTDAVGACCTSSGCVVTNIADCIDVQGGSFAGNATACFTPLPMTTDGAGAFEDISFSGEQIFFPGADDSVSAINLPFDFNFFGATYNSGHISTNGNFQFGSNNSAAYINTAIPTAAVPNNALYVLWDDHNLTNGGAVFTQYLGTPGVDERFIIQWNAVPQFVAVGSNTFQIALFPDGNFEFRYLDVGPESVAGDTTTIGFEDITGTSAVTVDETRDSLAAQLPISFRGNSQGQDTGVCGGSGCADCAADYDQDGGVTGADIAAFFADFEAGAACADVDQDGGVTGGDIGAFFLVFEAGGC